MLISLIFLGVNFIPSMWDAFQFTGATAAVCIGFIFPAAITLRDLMGGPCRILRDEEGKKFGLKTNEKSSGSVDKDVKMTDAEGSSSNGIGDSSKATSQEEVLIQGIMLIGLEIHEDSTRDVSSSGGFIEMDVDPLELEIGRFSSFGGLVRAVVLNAMLVADQFQNLEPIWLPH
ncbi:hypothetical protein TEA_005263 [Camellia sinensis var. sinensis]|uniref:Amino acid transporter transmembrane domain-containing protein n=1 Tax=Camellia sinensis var. sinensis TaxID=542762 RepID=A0A4S4DTR7_CAMSN|nr:hypothetical protein TEA_005263 [Camellia sinensis var. sinensis]